MTYESPEYPTEPSPAINPEFLYERIAAANYLYDLALIAFAATRAKFRNALRRLART